MKRTLLALPLLCLLSGAALAQSESIVGSWANKAEDCNTQFAYKVEPKGIAADEFMCEFATVSRTGDVVRWSGTCNNGDEPQEEVVTGTLANGLLTLRFQNGGGELPNLQRCPR